MQLCLWSTKTISWSTKTIYPTWKTILCARSWDLQIPGLFDLQSFPSGRGAGLMFQKGSPLRQSPKLASHSRNSDQCCISLCPQNKRHQTQPVTTSAIRQNTCRQASPKIPKTSMLGSRKAVFNKRVDLSNVWNALPKAQCTYLAPSGNKFLSFCSAKVNVSILTLFLRVWQIYVFSVSVCLFAFWQSWLCLINGLVMFWSPLKGLGGLISHKPAFCLPHLRIYKYSLFQLKIVFLCGRIQ